MLQVSFGTANMSLQYLSWCHCDSVTALLRGGGARYSYILSMKQAEAFPSRKELHRKTAGGEDHNTKYEPCSPRAVDVLFGSIPEKEGFPCN